MIVAITCCMLRSGPPALPSLSILSALHFIALTVSSAACLILPCSFLASSLVLSVNIPGQLAFCCMVPAASAIPSQTVRTLLVASSGHCASLCLAFLASNSLLMPFCTLFAVARCFCSDFLVAFSFACCSFSASFLFLLCICSLCSLTFCIHALKFISVRFRILALIIAVSTLFAFSLASAYTFMFPALPRARCCICLLAFTIMDVTSSSHLAGCSLPPPGGCDSGGA